jgi:hypothetical protein
VSKKQFQIISSTIHHRFNGNENEKYVMVVPFFARHRNYTFQHYNTHAHSARATKHILQPNNTGYAMACSPSGIKMSVLIYIVHCRSS